MCADLSSPATDTAKATRHAWFVLIMLSIMHGLNHAFYVMLGPLYVPMQQTFHFTQMSPVLLLGTAFLAPYGVSHLFFGIIADRVNKSVIVGLGALGSSLLFILAGIFPRYPVLLVAMVGAGICAATYHSVVPALITILMPRERGKGLGISGLGAALGLAFTPLLSGWICQNFSWEKNFLFFGLGGLLFSLLFLVTVRESGHEDSSTQAAGHSSSAAPVLSRRIVLLALLPLILFMAMREFCGWGSFALIPVFSQKIRGFTPEAAGRLAMCITLAGIGAGPLFGMLSDRVDRIRVLAPMIFFAGIMICILPFLPGPWLYAGVLLFGFFYLSTVPVLDALIGDWTPTAMKGTVFGLMMTIGIGAGATAPVAAGMLIDSQAGGVNGFHWGFWLFGGVIISALIPLYFARRQASSLPGIKCASPAEKC